MIFIELGAHFSSWSTSELAVFDPCMLRCCGRLFNSFVKSIWPWKVFFLDFAQAIKAFRIGHFFVALFLGKLWKIWNCFRILKADSYRQVKWCKKKVSHAKSSLFLSLIDCHLYQHAQNVIRGSTFSINFWN